MNICPDCEVDVFLLGENCLELLSDIIAMEQEGLHTLMDDRHVHWRLHRDGVYRMKYELDKALQLLERAGYLISTEIAPALIGVKVNREVGLVDENVICWCSNGQL